MKPRLPSCDWTSEDQAIFDRIEWTRCRDQRRMIERYIEADRCDADLMLEAQQNRRKILFGPVTDPPWKWVRMRGGESLGDFLRNSLK